MSLPRGETPGAGARPLAAGALSRLRPDWSARARADLRQTARYTQFVVYAKRGLLVASVILLAAVLAYSLQPRQQSTERLQWTFRNIRFLGNDLAMTHPRLASVDEEGDPYIVTAEVAIQDRLDAKRARLKNVQADVTLKGGQWMTGTAPAGSLDASKRLLTLSGAVAVFADNGNEAHTTSAIVNMDTGMIVGDHAVEGQGPFGTYRADRFRIDRDKKKKIVYLYGNVRMTFYHRAKRG